MVFPSCQGEGGEGRAVNFQRKLGINPSHGTPASILAAVAKAMKP